MKQKTRFKNFGNIDYRYWSMNGQYIGIEPQKAISVDLYQNGLEKNSMDFTISCYSSGSHFR